MLWLYCRYPLFKQTKGVEVYAAAEKTTYIHYDFFSSQPYTHSIMLYNISLTFHYKIILRVIVFTL